MNLNEVRDWLLLGGGILVWAFTVGVVWTKLVNKVDDQARDHTKDMDGIGRRVTAVEASCSTSGGRMDRFEKELSEYRRDAQDASKGLARVEKGVDDIHETINQGNLQLGSQLHAIEKSIQEKDVRTQLRLTRIETVAKIEEKIGPLPTESS